MELAAPLLRCSAAPPPHLDRRPRCSRAAARAARAAAPARASPPLAPPSPPRLQHGPSMSVRDASSSGPVRERACVQAQGDGSRLAHAPCEQFHDLLRSPQPAERKKASCERRRESIPAGMPHSCAHWWNRAPSSERCVRHPGERPRAPVEKATPGSVLNNPKGDLVHRATCRAAIPSSTNLLKRANVCARPTAALVNRRRRSQNHPHKSSP